MPAKKLKNRHATKDVQIKTDNIRTIELRRQIAMQLDPLAKVIRLANGQRVKGMRRRPSDDQIINAIYKLLDKYLPDLKAIELNEGEGKPLTIQIIGGLPGI